ncbi:tRNA lysidine(34) synthetase TilS [Bradyrhizobium erythrophlei]|jgi:tRNA(Ile)-lysidine synthase|uniref:tRNA(Ile)-lysidine synthase n=1 Tax=Bradyrhizobium erythrophlei TaxID=1437360 RepID=A0A1M7TGZ8_9BRAD|nr:tRNA lysidine(34) synthetase TilS [Bradyrhizobium erythrophlei]SHN70024.1 tRNA(Ile)-lysidine synthase [Bradyrhizobium erythrophlei]
MPEDDKSPISARQAKSLFADWKNAQALVLAVSGGPDSVALMWLAARWRNALSRGPRLLAVTVDHGLRQEAAREARDVKRLARTLGVAHRTMRWTAVKPKTGIPAAARLARYRLLTGVARSSGASHILTAHTRDDQAETLLMRLLRGSGIGGLAAMARESEREGVFIGRPFLNISKSQLIATLERAGIGFADDPTNRDPSFTRPRIRKVIEGLAVEGGDARNLARLASRLARANAAIEVLVDGAARYLALKDAAATSQPAALRPSNGVSFDAASFATLAEEIRLRLLLRAIERFGHEGPAELGKVEALLAAFDHTLRKAGKGRPVKLKQTLAGAVISLARGRIVIEPAPPRRRRGS